MLHIGNFHKKFQRQKKVDWDGNLLYTVKSPVLILTFIKEVFYKIQFLYKHLLIFKFKGLLYWVNL
jgi:hypothetical protein